MKQSKQKIFHHGLPPWHTVMTLAILATLSLAFLPRDHENNTTVTPYTFTHVLFPSYMNVTRLVVARGASAVFIFGMSLYAFFAGILGPERRHMIPPYLKQSKLQRGHPLPLYGFYSQLPFTMWCWNLLGLSFALNAYIAHSIQRDRPVAPWLPRVAAGLFATAAPLTLLVAAVVKYALWPQALSQPTRGPGDPTESFKYFRALCFHNVNVILAMSEKTLWGDLPVRGRDVSLAVLFGCIYVVFSWAIRHRWKPSAGPQFLYFFMDTTLGATTTWALVALCGVLMLFHGLFCALHEILGHLGGGIIAHISTVLLVCVLVCRVRD